MLGKHCGRLLSRYLLCQAWYHRINHEELNTTMSGQLSFFRQYTGEVLVESASPHYKRVLVLTTTRVLVLTTFVLVDSY